MKRVLDELDPFFWMVAVVVAGITIVDRTDFQMVSPYSDFVQAMTEPVEQVQ